MTDLQTVRSSFGIFAESWNDGLAAKRRRWVAKCVAMMSCMLACGMCATVVFPTMRPHSHCMSAMDAFAILPPASVANMHLHRHTQAPGTRRRPQPRTYACYGCKKGQGTNRFLVRHTPEDMQRLLRADPAEVQLLSFLDVTSCMQERYKGFAHGAIDVDTLIRHPLVSWNEDQTSSMYRPCHDTEMMYGKLLRTNPLYRRYRCLLELDDGETCFPIVPSAYVHSIVDRAIARGPKLVAESNPLPHVLSTVVDVPMTPIREGIAPRSTAPIKVGDITLAGERVTERSEVLMLPGDIDIPDREGLTLETALFPFLFPHATGQFDGSMTLNAYLRMRMLQGFSVFTMFKPYLLLMFQVRQSMMLAKNVASYALSKSMHDHRKRHPGASEAEVMAQAIKWNVPATMPGTPGYHRSQLQDLLCRVQTWGVPDLFLTLTADETSELRFKEIDSLDAYLTRFGASLDWHDAPVECSRLFLTRYKAFMSDWVVGERSAQILGRVTHHITRIEVQHRGSLHVHTLLWLHEDDIDRVADEIIAYVPAAFDDATQSFIPPDQATQPLEYLLYKIVCRKHMHKCTQWAGKAEGCRDDKGRCKMLFPFSPSPTLATSFDPKIMRYVYCRMRECDRNVVPYHPTVALVWNASTNLQRITGTAWSIYILKYAMKSKPSGKLDLGPEVAARLHLSGVPQDTLKLISNMVMAKPVSPAEAAVLMMQEDLVAVSEGGRVHYVCSSLPAQRSVLLRSRKPCTHPLDKYVQRPDCLGHVTFVSYFTDYKVVDKKDSDTGYVGVDLAGKHVYELSEPLLVRFSDYNPSTNSEGFFFQLLLQEIPFAVEADLISEGNTAEQEYFYECIIRGILCDMDDVQAKLDEYARMHLYDDQYRTQLFDELSTSLQGINHGPLSEAFAFDANALGGERSRSRAPQQSWIDTLSPFDSVVLPCEQRSVVDRIMAHPKGMHAVSGVPGSGKTFLIKYLARHLARADKVVRISATTGAAAARIGPFATTCHSSFALPVKDDYVPCMSRTDPRFEELLGVDVFIVDEMSMLTAANLDLILMRIYTAVRFLHPEVTHANFLEHKCLILVGDHGQLPAVCRHNVPSGGYVHVLSLQ